MSNKIKWHVIKLETNNGLKIGMSENKDDGKVIKGNLSYEKAKIISEECSRRLNIPPFDNRKDISLH